MTKFDDMAWKQLHARPAPTGTWADHKGLAKSGRPKNFAELEILLRRCDDWEVAFPSFLDEFYLFSDAEFFALEPTDYFDRKTRVWFAGIAEYLCHRFGLAVPEWVENSDYFLPEPWRKSHDDTGELEFRRRNVLYNPRHLIRL